MLHKQLLISLLEGSSCRRAAGWSSGTSLLQLSGLSWKIKNLLFSSAGSQEVTLAMPGTLPSFPSLPRGVTVPVLLGSLPRGVNPPSLPRGFTMPSLSTLPSFPSFHQGITIPSLPRGVTLPRFVTMPTLPQAPRRLLQDCCSMFDHQNSG
ncbi:hypothetical protein AMECASPLE_006494, partial [Ameca splendens]